MKRKWTTESNASHRKQFYFNAKMDTREISYNGNFPNFREPREIGHFSIDSNRQFCDDKSQLKTYITPSNSDNCCFDLNKGYDMMIYKDETIPSYLDNLLRWIMIHTDKFSTHTDDKNKVLKSLNTDFICWRGLLTKIMCIPYESREDLRIGVIRSGGTYYMCQFDTEAKKIREGEKTEKDKRMCAWGWKFEQYVTADRPGGKSDTDKPVNNNEEYGVVVRSRLGSHSLVYGAEVDCLDPKGEKYLELKTSRITQARRQYENFCRYKLIKFWAQSFLIGIERIVCGFRDDEGVIRNVKDFTVKEIPKHADSVMRGFRDWKPAVCFNLLNSFLDFVKTCVPDDDARCVYMFYWKPGSQLVCEGKGDESLYFLPEWFLKSRISDEQS